VEKSLTKQCKVRWGGKESWLGGCFHQENSEKNAKKRGHNVKVKKHFRG